MALLSPRIAGLGALRARLAGLPNVAAGAADTALRAVAQDVVAAIRENLSRSDSGVSAPGAVPADPSGRLAAATHVVATEAGGTEAPGGAGIVVTQPYAQDLEFGTIHMAARPFLRPAALAAAASARTRLATALRTALSNSKGTIP